MGRMGTKFLFKTNRAGSLVGIIPISHVCLDILSSRIEPKGDCLVSDFKHRVLRERSGLVAVVLNHASGNESTSSVQNLGSRSVYLGVVI